MIFKKISQQATIAALILTCALPLTGCQMPTIFREKTKPFEIEELSASEIEQDTYYVKSGTKFMAVYLPYGTVRGYASQPSNDRVIYMNKREALIPTLYKGDTLALKTAEMSEIGSVVLERFKDAGYSVGIYGAAYDSSSKMITLSAKESIGGGTPADALTSWSDEISIETIGSNQVTKDMLDSSGNISCLEKDKTYEFGYYTGSEYKTTELTASQHILESWEMFTLTDIETTKRGYISINIPEDYKSGWYLIEGKGFFKYVDHARGEGEMPEGEAMNEEYYASAADAMSVYAQLYSVSLEKDKSKPTIEVIYNKASLSSGEEVKGMVLAPDGTSYDMEQSDTKPLVDSDDSTYYASGVSRAYLSCNLENAMAGKWQVILTPKSIEVLTVKVINNGLDEQTTEVDKTFTFDEPQKNMTFYAQYECEKQDADYQYEPNVFGYLIYPDGTTYNLEAEYDDKLLSYTVIYLPAGTYEVRMFHYSDVELTEDNIGATDDTSSLHTETITNVSG